jgi:signal transduction histidine kinase
MATAQALPEFRDALSRLQHTALVPVLEDSELVGMLVLSRYEHRPFLPADVPSLTAFGALAGLALRNAKLYERATATTRRLQAATDAAAAVAALPDLPALLQRIIEHACEAAGADSASIMRLEDGAGVIEATSGTAPIGSRWPLGDEVGETLAAGRPAQVVTADTEVSDDLAPYAAPYSLALIAPLRFSGDLLGILVLGRFHGRPAFSEDDIEGLQQFVTLAALVLHNGRLVHRLREAEKMKREFTNIAVHELRGPLTVIDGYAALLLEGDSGVLDEEVERQLATIRRQATHARTLVVAAAVERALPRAHLHSGTIEMPRVADVRALGDVALVARVVDNLLTNAIAYSVLPPSITVSLTDDGDHALVRVQDNGPGVEQAEHECSFARFARGAHTGATKGTALGLYLSRECARRMGGDLVLEESAPDTGSRFLLSLPSAQDRAHDPAPA